jgi:hypothetical protein
MEPTGPVKRRKTPPEVESDTAADDAPAPESAPALLAFPRGTAEPEPTEQTAGLAAAPEHEPALTGAEEPPAPPPPEAAVEPGHEAPPDAPAPPPASDAVRSGEAADTKPRWDPGELRQVLTPLEDRVRRLEEALAQLHQDPSVPPPSDPPAAPPTHAITTPMTAIPAAPQPLPTALPASPSWTEPPLRSGRLWLPFEIWMEARVIVRMMVDPRYQMSWSGRVVPLVLLALFVTSWWWMPLTSLPAGVGYLINKAADLVVCFVLFKVLGHEARRYRLTAPDLPPRMRLHRDE